MVHRILGILAIPLLLFAFTKSVTHPKLISDSRWCDICGMNLPKFFKTNHAVVLKDGSKKEYCSLHCFAQDYRKIGEKVERILVVDGATGEWIEAPQAFYVVGSDVEGTMSPVSKIAFKSREEAEKFVREHGGEIMDFDEVLKIALKSLERENERIMRKKRLKIYPMGKMLYKRYCKEGVDKGQFHSLSELKEYLLRTCPPEIRENGKRLQALALYIWEAKDRKRVEVPKEAKCPICGMFVAKYPRWAALIVTSDGEKLYFDGVKDMMKYYLRHRDRVREVIVTDYYSGEAIDGKRAYYVLGSDLYGPMGKELIPFKREREAREFMRDHGGRVIRFDEIDGKVIEKL
ncbi:MAG: nitrous oxide reductase [Epsilonproteobacteria bacterium]|nr:nitrous oxide reductase [Campylobacterota bacterium]NPA56924.1 nitrous oxide reductase [Campylobacterota bacterium]